MVRSSGTFLNYWKKLTFSWLLKEKLCLSLWAKTGSETAFLVDIMTYLNTLDISLQGCSQMVTQMYDSLHSFLAKLCLWETHLARNSLAHFSTLKLVSENEKDGLNYIPQIKELKTEFQKRFSDFRLYENELILFSSPSPLILIMWMKSYKWKLPNCSATLYWKWNMMMLGSQDSTHTLGMVTLSIKTIVQRFCPCLEVLYVCVQLFSAMKLNKTKYCSQLKDSKMNPLQDVATQNPQP